VPPFITRLLFVPFGIFVRYHVKSAETGDQPSLKSIIAKHKPLAIAANHCGTFDVLPFLALHPVNVLLDAHFYASVRSTFHKVVGAIPLDQSNKHLGDRREKMRGAIANHLASARYPLLFFPEGWDTNAHRGILMYNKFLFSLGYPILPVALRVRVPLLGLEPGVLGVRFWSELLWLLFYPALVYDLTFLPVETKRANETEEEFARRVQALTGAELGVCPTRYFNKDALRLRMALFRQYGLRAKLLNGEFEVPWEEAKEKDKSQ